MEVNSLDEEGKDRREIVKSVSNGKIQVLETSQQHIDRKGVPELPF